MFQGQKLVASPLFVFDVAEKDISSIYIDK